MWYACMSFTDWFIHRYLMHGAEDGFMNKIPQLKHLRDAHQIHHNSSRRGNVYDYGEFFVPLECFYIICLTYPFAYLTNLLFWHTFGVSLLIASHNYAHTTNHGHIPPTFSFPIPSSLCSKLKDHHEIHHKYSNTNFCTIALSFDIFANILHT